MGETLGGGPFVALVEGDIDGETFGHQINGYNAWWANGLVFPRSQGCWLAIAKHSLDLYENCTVIGRSASVLVGSASVAISLPNSSDEWALSPEFDLGVAWVPEILRVQSPKLPVRHTARPLPNSSGTWPTRIFSVTHRSRSLELSTVEARDRNVGFPQDARGEFTINRGGTLGESGGLVLATIGGAPAFAGMITRVEQNPDGVTSVVPTGSILEFLEGLKPPL